MVFPFFINICCGQRVEATTKKSAPRKVLFFHSYNQLTLVVLSMHNFFATVKAVSADMMTTVGFTSGRLF
ncbi:MAG: hypothetical protein ACJAYE_002473 [Candidatus Azotimanducaceae bacterium]|jgi:hypothetical protein